MYQGLDLAILHHFTTQSICFNPRVSAGKRKMWRKKSLLHHLHRFSISLATNQSCVSHSDNNMVQARTYSRIKPVDGFLCIFTVAFLLFHAPAGGSNPAESIF